MALTIDQLEIQIVAETTNVTQTLDGLIGRLKTLRNQLNGLGGAGKNAGEGLQETANGASKASSAIDKQGKSYDKASKYTKSFTDKLAQQISKYRTLMGAFKTAAQKMGDLFTESNKYIETLNLFNVTMGDGADAAYKYAENVQKLVGIDIAEWMQYQGTLKNLTSGFGVAGDAANTMSQNLTQLSYDMASFFNTDVETAFDKLSSAMSGQVKGLREFGIDTTVASLQEYALAKGIDTKVRSMTQAEKSMLRYNYIMEKSIIMQGDMARTLITPANSLRILSAQLTQMKRALGNVISVIAVKFIPYVQAMVEIITDAANTLANFFGFELPKIDYSSIGGNMTSEFEDAEDSLDGVSGSLKKIKKQLMGFDELNIISDPDSGSSSGSSVGGALGNMELLEYDFLKNLDLSGLDKVKKKIKEIWKTLKPIATLVAGIFAVATVMNFLSALKKLKTLWVDKLFNVGLLNTFLQGFDDVFITGAGVLASFKGGLSAVNQSMSTTQKAFLGIATAAAEFIVIFTLIKDLTYSINTGTATTGQIITTLIAGIAALGVAWVAFYTVFMATGIGALIATIATAVVALVAGIAGFVSGVKEAGETIYKSSEDFKIMQASIENTTAIADRCAESVDSMKAAVDRLDESSLNYAIAKNLTTEIFDLNEKAHLSQYELAQLKVKVETLNGLNIDGLHLAIDETTGRVIQTRQETENLIAALEKEAKFEAMRDILVESYKAQYQAIEDNNAAYDEYTMVSDAVRETQEKLADTAWYEFGKRSELTAQLEKQKKAMESARKAFNDSRSVNEKATKTIETITKEYEKLALGQEKVVSTTQAASEEISKSASGANTNAANVVAGATKGIKDNSKKYTSAVKDMANGGNDAFADAIDSHSPAKKYIEYAKNIILGLTNGITNNKQTVLNAMKSLASDMGNAFNKSLNFDDMVTKINKSLKNIKIPSFKDINLNVSFSTWVSSDKKKIYEALGLSGWPSLYWYAEGGFPNAGQMFIAREAGPELVGSIGRKTAVANNDQIVSGIESGVYRAMVAANSSNKGGSQTIRIINQIDGDVVGEKVIQYHNGRVIQTGVSPLLV